MASDSTMSVPVLAAYVAGMEKQPGISPFSHGLMVEMPCCGFRYDAEAIDCAPGPSRVYSPIRWTCEQCSRTWTPGPIGALEEIVLAQPATASEGPELVRSGALALEDLDEESRARVEQAMTATIAIDQDELAAWKTVAAIADTMLWPCRRHRPDGCDDCGACRMVRALHAVGLGHDLHPGTPEVDGA